MDLTNLPVVGEGDFCSERWVSQFQSCSFIFCYIPIHTYDEKISHEGDPSLYNNVVSSDQPSPTPSPTLSPTISPTTPTSNPNPNPNPTSTPSTTSTTSTLTPTSSSTSSTPSQSNFIPAHVRAQITRQASQPNPVKPRTDSLRQTRTFTLDSINNGNKPLNTSTDSTSTTPSSSQSQSASTNTPSPSNSPNLSSSPAKVEDNNSSPKSEGEVFLRPRLATRSASYASFNTPKSSKSKISITSTLSQSIKSESSNTTEQKPNEQQKPTEKKPTEQKPTVNTTTNTNQGNKNTTPQTEAKGDAKSTSSKPIEISAAETTTTSNSLSTSAPENERPRKETKPLALQSPISPEKILGFSLSESPTSKARKSAYRQSKSLNSNSFILNFILFFP